MDRVLNKDFILGSYLNSAQVFFSDVFMSCILYAELSCEKAGGVKTFSFLKKFCLRHSISASYAWELMRSGNAC